MEIGAGEDNVPEDWEKQLQKARDEEHRLAEVDAQTGAREEAPVAILCDSATGMDQCVVLRNALREKGLRSVVNPDAGVLKAAAPPALQTVVAFVTIGAF